MAVSSLPPLISSDGHLEVRPERWTPRMPARYRERAPRTVQLPDGGDALLVPGQPPRPVPFLDLYPTPADDRFWAAAIDLAMPLTVHVGFDRQGPRASQPTFEYPGVDPGVLARLGGRTIVEWVALPFLGTA